MVHINFILDNNFLASYILSNYKSERFIEYAKDKYKKDIVKFQDIAFKKSKDVYMVIDGRFPTYKFGIQNGSSSFNKIGNLIDTFLNELVCTDEFALLKKQTEESIEKIKGEWTQNFVDTSEYIKDLGIDLEGNFNFYISHPGLKSGNNVGNNNIVWSYQEYWPNYNTIYMWHEILHSYFDHDDKSHAVIELITDEEMRTRLNGGEYPPFVGHPFLNDIKTQNLKKWRDYLSTSNKDINNLVGSFSS